MSFLDGVTSNWIDKYGMLTCHKDGSPSDNGLSWCSEYVISRILVEKPDEETKKDWAKSWSELIDKCEMEPGLFRRTPVNGYQQGPDDLIGVCAASKLLGTNHAERIYNYMWSHFGIYNTIEPGKFTWRSFLGVRQPGTVVHFKECMNVGTSQIEKSIARLAFKVSEATGNQTMDKRLAYLCALSTSDSVLKKTISEVLKGRYTSIADMYRKYFAKQERLNSHPITQMYSKDLTVFWT